MHHKFTHYVYKMPHHLSAPLLCFLCVTQAIYGQTPADSLRVKALNEAVVTGTNKSESKEKIPFSISRIDSQQLEASGKSEVLAALSGRVPSLFVSERNTFGFGVSTGGSGAIRVRGVGGSPTSGVLMMVDGQPQFAGIFSHPVADFYTAEYVKSVEIVRGPGSVLYGSNAMGGVINVITKESEHNGARTSLMSKYGSYNTWQTALTNTLRYGNFSSLVSLSYDRTDGVTKGFDFKQKSLYAKLGYDFSRQWKARMDYSLVNFVGNDPVYPRLSNPESTDVYHQNITRGAASLAVSNRYEKSDGALRVYYSYGNHYIDDPRHFHSLDNRLGIIAYQNFTPWTDANATIGLDFDTYSGKIPISGGTAHAEGSRTTIERKNVTEYSPYISLSQSLWHDLLTLNVGLRMANSDLFGTHWVPQGGIALNPGKGWTLKASVAKGYRNPSFREMYLYMTANPDLRPESMVNHEVSLSKRFSHLLTLEATAYLSKGKDMIQVVEQKNVNTGRFTNKGIEITAESHPVKGLDIRASYSYLHTTLKALTAAPKNQYYLGITCQPAQKWTIDAEMRGVGSLYVAEGIHHQDYVLVNLKTTYRPTKWVSLFVQTDNLTNARYTINRGYEMPGFTMMGGFRLSF